MTKNSDETFNLQPNPDRWFYEVQEMTKMILDGDQEKMEKGLETMLSVIEIIESSRKKAGILFTDEK